MEYLLDEVKYCKKVMKKEFNKPLRMTKDDEERFQKAEECHICNKKYTKVKVKDDHRSKFSNLSNWKEEA